MQYYYLLYMMYEYEQVSTKRQTLLESWRESTRRKPKKKLILRRCRDSHGSTIVCRRPSSCYYSYFYFIFAIIYYLSTTRLSVSTVHNTSVPGSPTHLSNVVTVTVVVAVFSFFLTRVHFGARVHDVLVDGLIVCYYYSQSAS